MRLKAKFMSSYSQINWFWFRTDRRWEKYLCFRFNFSPKNTNTLLNDSRIDFSLITWITSKARQRLFEMTHVCGLSIVCRVASQWWPERAVRRRTAVACADHNWPSLWSALLRHSVNNSQLVGELQWVRAAPTPLLISRWMWLSIEISDSLSNTCSPTLCQNYFISSIAVSIAVSHISWCHNNTSEAFGHLFRFSFSHSFN